jgi:hypothetical protein
LGQIFMICLLSQYRGIMVHASGIDDNGRGYLFAGHSGHGKSTLCSLWEGSARILTDDRIILRRTDEGFLMYPTPWPGSYSSVTARPTILEKIFFVSHGEENSLVRKKLFDANCDLLTRSFPPLWDAEGMKFTMDFISDLIERVPCFDMAFVPDKSAIDYLRCGK